MLGKFVKPARVVDGIQSTLFDYQALLASKTSLTRLGDYVASLASFKPSCLSMDGKLAFWANAYNALIIHLVVSDALHNDGQLPKSIQDLKGNATAVWSRRAGIVAGKAMTLEEVLTEARNLGDPRIHAAVNCASLSCPDLRSSVYIADDVQAQLDTQVKKWLHNPTKGAMMKDNGLLVSKIFEWHAEDFPSLSFFIAEQLGISASSTDINGYLPYNWDLNAVGRSTSTSSDGGKSTSMDKVGAQPDLI